jgi:anti-sigma B factor antagonist
MEIRDEARDGMLILHISGPVDSTTGPRLADELQRVVEEGESHLVLDLRDVPYMSSAGLRALMIGVRLVRAPDKDGDMYLTNLSKTVSLAFRISGFDQLFNIYETVPEAVTAMAASMDYGAEGSGAVPE